LLWVLRWGSGAWGLSFGLFLLATTAWLRLETFAWDLSLGMGTFVWDISLGTFRLGSFAWELSLGNFRL
jgi:hypothetical protein